MLPEAELAELSDHWKSPFQRAFSLLIFCSIDLLSGGVGRAPLSCRIISRRRTRSWTNALVDESSRGRKLSDPTLSLNRSSQRRSRTRSFFLSYDFLSTNALLA